MKGINFFKGNVSKQILFLSKCLFYICLLGFSTVFVRICKKCFTVDPNIANCKFDSISGALRSFAFQSFLWKAYPGPPSPQCCMVPVCTGFQRTKARSIKPRTDEQFFLDKFIFSCVRRTIFP